MIKVMWFLKRADGLTIEEFHDWWVNKHAPDICKDQSPYLVKYVIDTSVQDTSALPGNARGKDLDWDGVGIQYFESEEAYRAVYSRQNRPTTAEATSKIRSICRLVVKEHVIDVSAGLPT